jgi:sugar phosphate isomerase/epimerase
MRELLAVAKQEGVTVCLENMPFLDFSLSSPSDIVGFIEEINDPFFAMCLDTGHANVCRNWSSPAEAMRKYGNHIKVLHVHDNRGKRDEHTVPFSGTIDWDDFSHALQETDFQGVLSLECYPSAKLPQDICEDMYALYGRIATAISRLHTQQ